MSRTLLLGAASAAALACLTAPAFAAPTATVTGGGSSLVSGDIGAVGITNTELNAFGDSNFTYVSSGSGSGRNAFITNNQNCNTANVGGYPATCAAGGKTVQYGNTDAPYGTTELAALNNAGTATHQVNSTFGNVIEIPFLGTAVAIPTVNSSATANGTARFTDADLCGIFSGKLTNWNQTSAKAKLAAGAIVVAYRFDSSGTTNLFTNHLTAVCNSTNSNFLGTTATTGPAVTSTFASILPAATIASANFVALSGSGNIASYLSKVGGVLCTGQPAGKDCNGKTLPSPVTSAISYLSPDFTSIAPKSAAKLNNGAHSTLLVAAVNGQQPTGKATSAALAAIDPSWPGNTNITPPGSVAAAQDATRWIPAVQKVSAGYPIVGYTDIVTAQCYKVVATGKALTGFLADHYNTGFTAFQKVISNNGFVNVSSALLTALNTYILPGSTDTGTQIRSTSGCAGFAGRS